MLAKFQFLRKLNVYQIAVLRLEWTSNQPVSGCQQKQSKQLDVYIVRETAKAAAGIVSAWSREALRLVIINKCLPFRIICNLKDSCCS